MSKSSRDLTAKEKCVLSGDGMSLVMEFKRKPNKKKTIERTERLSLTNFKTKESKEKERVEEKKRE